MSKPVIWHTICRPTKEELDEIRVGMLVKCNDWVKPMRVKAVSANYFIMVRNHFGRPLYSICEKIPSKRTYRNFIEGLCSIGPDNMIFGIFDYFDQKDLYECIKRLEDKDDEFELSERRSTALETISYRLE